MSERRTGLLASILAAAALLAAACGPSVSFVQTGPAGIPRPEDAPVKAYLTGPPSTPYEQIGVAEVEGGNLAARVEAAQRVARQHGGDAVVLLGSSTGVASQTSTSYTHVRDNEGNSSMVAVPTTKVSSYTIQTFAVIREQGRSVPRGAPPAAASPASQAAE